MFIWFLHQNNEMKISYTYKVDLVSTLNLISTQISRVMFGTVSFIADGIAHTS